MKYRYNTRVKIIKDDAHNGFYAGIEGVLWEWDTVANAYVVKIDDRTVLAKEEDIELA